MNGVLFQETLVINANYAKTRKCPNMKNICRKWFKMLMYCVCLVIAVWLVTFVYHFLYPGTHQNCRNSSNSNQIDARQITNDPYCAQYNSNIRCQHYTNSNKSNEIGSHQIAIDPYYIDDNCNITCQNSTNSSQSNETNLIEIKDDTYCALYECNVTCKNLPATLFLEEEIKLLLNESSCASITLILTNYNFPDNKIKTNWLNASELNITELAIQSTSVTRIDDDAFASTAFQNLTHLTVESSKITYLQKNALRALKLSTFHFCFAVSTSARFEEGLLEHVAHTLETLQLNFCIMNTTTLRNITGTPSVVLKKLVTLDLQNSSLESLESDVIVYTPVLAKIVLSHLGLTNVHIHAFSRLRSLRCLYLNANSLRRLPNGIFDDMIPARNETFIALENNEWMCDCEIQWLKDFYLNNNYFDKNVSLYCHNDDDKRFEEVDFCPEDDMTTILTDEMANDVLAIGDERTTDATHDSPINVD